MRKLFNNIISKKHDKKQPNAQTPHDQGIHLLHSGKDPIVDIVAIHGDPGHWYRSWTDLVSGTCWLQDVLPLALPRSRVFSFGYGTGTDLPVEETATRLREELGQQRVESPTRALVYVAHSFGGMLVKGTLASSSSPAHPPQGLLLFGSPPDAGAQLSSLLSAGVNDVSASPEVAAMKRDAQWLRAGTQQFQTVEGRFRVLYFREVGAVGAVGAEQVQGGDDEVIQLSKTHGAMIRFASAEDEDLKIVMAALCRMVEEMVEKGEGETELEADSLV